LIPRLLRKEQEILACLSAQERKERDAIKQALDVLMKERKPAS